jgi:hypothetical protein
VAPYSRYFLGSDGEVVIEDTRPAEDLDSGQLFATVGFVA